MVDQKSVPEFVERPFTEEEKKRITSFVELREKQKNLAAFRHKEQQRYLKEGLFFDHIEAEIKAILKEDDLMLKSNEALFNYNNAVNTLNKGTIKKAKELEDMKKDGDTKQSV